MLPGYPFVTTAKCAQTFTKRKVDIKAYTQFGIALIKTAFYGFLPLLSGKPFGIPIGYRRIAGISGTGNIVFGNKITHIKIALNQR
jgi:hypothetical protein